MKELNVNHYEIDKNSDLKDIEAILMKEEPVDINVINWKEYPYCPKTNFRILYSNYAIYLKFIVTEDGVLATKQSMNEQVFKDSCVELFLFPGDGYYHNFEFNCIGTYLTGAQTARDTNRIAKTDTGVRTLPSLGREVFGRRVGLTTWELTVEIPFASFTNKSIDEIRGSSMKANLYKCGDETDTPHYVTWNNIDTENPDFHRPECFGVINFK